MGKIKYLHKIKEFCRKSPVVDIYSLKKLIGENKEYVHLMLNKLVQQHELYRITRGMYSTHDDPVLAVFCFKPAYIGLQEALSIHNLWEQETNAVILSTKIVREGVRNVFGNNILIKRLKPEYFFGFEYIQYGDWVVPVSDIEKTCIDMAYFNQPIDKQLMHEFKKRINKKKLKEYLEKYDKNIREKVLDLMKE